MENLDQISENQQEQVVVVEEKKSFDYFQIAIYLSIPVLFYFMWLALILGLPSMQESYFKMHDAAIYSGFAAETNPVPSKLIVSEGTRVKKLAKTYGNFSNYQPYLIINTSDNTFTLFNNGKLVREGICSTGSFVLLDAGDEKKWMFETPKGVLRIQGKTESPVWRKPDWAFIEEGLPVPKHANSFERYEYGVLGDYALSIGNGYMIHGTLYKRFLGMPVTHGCVRMDDPDLEKVFNTLRLGSKVYIF